MTGLVDEWEPERDAIVGSNTSRDVAFAGDIFDEVDVTRACKDFLALICELKLSIQTKFSQSTRTAAHDLPEPTQLIG